MGVLGMRLKYELEGKSVLDLEPINEQKKSIATTRSFPKQITDLDALRERVVTFAAVCAEKLRTQKSGCHTIIVMLVVDRHKYENQKCKSVVFRAFNCCFDRIGCFSVYCNEGFGFEVSILNNSKNSF
jgi:nucleotidyltransferase/DNA polymerase involved in DNA repair